MVISPFKQTHIRTYKRNNAFFGNNFYNGIILITFLKMWKTVLSIVILI